MTNSSRVPLRPMWVLGGLLALVAIGLGIASVLPRPVAEAVPKSEPSELSESESVSEVEPSATAGVQFAALAEARTADLIRDARKLSRQYGLSAAAPFLELSRMRGEPGRGPVAALGAKAAGLPPSSAVGKVFRRVWAEPYEPIPGYADFKAAVYKRIDPRFVEYFADTEDARIRLDEVRWGGVPRDGIPPLKDPERISADDPAAAYMGEDDVVFGVSLSGEAVAYPKRILGWHEMVKDTVGGVSICGVYCTLCGSMIIYETDLDGTHYELGTSGFLYRSNKLMYDHATKSMWSTLEGRPVIGPLVRADPPIELNRRYVVTTTWGEWRRRHPDTEVLTLQTGHNRNYGEGVAYRSYFATDNLMFAVPDGDDQGLKNKQEILGLRFKREDGTEEQLAITADYLRANNAHSDEVAGTSFVVLTDNGGGNRAYTAGEPPIESYDGDAKAVDSAGAEWVLTEDALVSGEQRRERLPAHRAFWFGWRSAYPDTRLVE